jgi:hypothetical protein
MLERDGRKSDPFEIAMDDFQSFAYAMLGEVSKEIAGFAVYLAASVISVIWRARNWKDSPPTLQPTDSLQLTS